MEVYKLEESEEEDTVLVGVCYRLSTGTPVPIKTARQQVHEAILFL